MLALDIKVRKIMFCIKKIINIIEDIRHKQRFKKYGLPTSQSETWNNFSVPRESFFKTITGLLIRIKTKDILIMRGSYIQRTQYVSKCTLTE